MLARMLASLRLAGMRSFRGGQMVGSGYRKLVPAVLGLALCVYAAMPPGTSAASTSGRVVTARSRPGACGTR
jgi:hypothetical protein